MPSNGRRPDVLHVLAPGAYGGLERVVQDLAAAQRDAGRAVAVAAISSDDSAGAFLEPLRSRGVDVHRVEVPARAYHRERREVRALLRQLRPGIVHTHGYRADVVDGPVPGRLGMPAVATVHGFTGGGWRNRVYEMLQIRAYRHHHAVVAVADSVAAHLRARGVDPARIHVVRNAWRPSEEPLPRARARAALHLDDAVPVIGWVGRLSPEKGAASLIEAMRLSTVPYHVAVLGDGPEATTLRARAASLGIAGRVHWLGAVPRAARYFTAFDVFVLSSLTEGTPMVLFEAMDCGVPIVATRVGGVPDVVGPDEAILVPPADTRALAGAIDGVLSAPDAAATRVAAAKSRLRAAFTAPGWVDSYDAVYDVARERLRGHGPRREPVMVPGVAEARS